jgi:polar amino acid transport system substrate-binding protein
MKFLIILIVLIQCLHAESYTFSGGKNNVVHIISKNILQKVYKRAGIKAFFVFEALQKSLQDSNSGINDGQIARIENINKKFPNLRRVPISTIEVQAVAFSKNSRLNIKSFSDLKGTSFAIVKGAKFIEYATKEYDKVLKA